MCVFSSCAILYPLHDQYRYNLGSNFLLSVSTAFVLCCLQLYLVSGLGFSSPDFPTYIYIHWMQFFEPVFVHSKTLRTDSLYWIFGRSAFTEKIKSLFCYGMHTNIWSIIFFTAEWETLGAIAFVIQMEDAEKIGTVGIALFRRPLLISH